MEHSSSVLQQKDQHGHSVGDNISHEPHGLGEDSLNFHSGQRSIGSVSQWTSGAALLNNGSKNSTPLQQHIRKISTPGQSPPDFDMNLMLSSRNSTPVEDTAARALKDTSSIHWPAEQVMWSHELGDVTPGLRHVNSLEMDDTTADHGSLRTTGEHKSPPVIQHQGAHRLHVSSGSSGGTELDVTLAGQVKQKKRRIKPKPRAVAYGTAADGSPTRSPGATKRKRPARVPDGAKCWNTMCPTPHSTPMMRKIMVENELRLVCNACGIFFKRHSKFRQEKGGFGSVPGIKKRSRKQRESEDSRSADRSDTYSASGSSQSGAKKPRKVVKPRERKEKKDLDKPKVKKSTGTARARSATAQPQETLLGLAGSGEVLTPNMREQSSPDDHVGLDSPHMVLSPPDSKTGAVTSPRARGKGGGTRRSSPRKGTIPARFAESVGLPNGLANMANRTNSHAATSAYVTGTEAADSGETEAPSDTAPPSRPPSETAPETENSLSLDAFSRTAVGRQFTPHRMRPGESLQPSSDRHMFVSAPFATPSSYLPDGAHVPSFDFSPSPVSPMLSLIAHSSERLSF